MKILIVTTGGTICSTTSAENGNKNNVNTGAVLPVLVDEAKNSLKNDFDITDLSFDIVSPINVLSENMTIEAWNVLLAALREVDYGKYNGLIILHGTDSLHMTAPLISLMMKGIGCPVILVSGNRIITDPESNAVENFANAVRMINVISINKPENESLESNVFPSDNTYVVYRNMNGISYVHRAALLEECADYSEDFFSAGMIRFEEWIEKETIEGKSVNKIDIEEEVSVEEALDNDHFEGPPLIKKNILLTDDVLYIKPYVGINYNRFSLEEVRCVLHGLYHSSTANAADDSAHSALHLLKRCKDAGIPMYIYPCNKDSYRYVTTKALLEAGAIPLNGGTWNLAYSRLLVANSKKTQEQVR